MSFWRVTRPAEELELEAFSGMKLADVENSERSWVSVTGVYNWLDCRVLIWFSFCFLPEKGRVQLAATGMKGTRET